MTTSQRQVVSAPRHSAGPRKPQLLAPLPLVAAVALSAVLLAAALVVVALLSQGHDRPRSAAPGGSSPGPTALDASQRPSVAAAIELDPLPTKVPRMRPVPLTGTAREVPPGTRLVVQDLTGPGTWTSFPLRPVVDDQGRFRTYVELGAAGMHHLRVVEPRAVISSDVWEVRVR